MNTTHTSKTTRCWFAVLVTAPRLIVSASVLLAGNACIAAEESIPNGNFDDKVNTVWKKAQLDPDSDGQQQMGTEPSAVEEATVQNIPVNIKGKSGRIGKKPGGADGKDGAVLYQDFECPGTEGHCTVTFDFAWAANLGNTNSQGETPAVFLARTDGKTHTGIRTVSGLLGGEWQNDISASIPKCDGLLTRVGFYVQGSENGTQTTLLIDNVRHSCSTLTHGEQAPFSGTMKGDKLAVVPDGPVRSLLVVAPLGYSVLGNVYAAGGNTFGEVLAGVSTGTSLFKWDSRTQTYAESIYGADGKWQPSGTLAPGEGVFIHSASQQIVALSGRAVPQLARPRRPAGRYLASVTEPTSQRFEEFMGFLPAPGDRVETFSQPSFVFPPPPTSTYTYDASKGWLPSEPILEPGQGASVEVVNTGVVIGRDQLKLQLGAVGDGVALLSSLPIDSKITLQTAPQATGPWTTASGVQTPFFPALDAQTKFFRLFMPP